MEKEVIIIQKLNKGFRTKLKEEGLKGSIKSLFKPKFKNIKAVNNISFSVNEGELVAFIGPNGAGKSTTLKMLSGILYPDSGKIRVLGLDPQKQRKKLAYSIGTVFGQKPQLWFHLPAIDSFNLFSKIYELEEAEYRKRLHELIKRFEIKDIVNQPVRKLSLGQRMRCEIVLSLLHKPKVLFLDEPTIGLDIIIKKNIRDLIKKINEEEKVTVILTSHDMGDVEKICKRIVVINKGIIVYDGNLKAMKKSFLTKKIIKVLSENKISVREHAGLKVVKKTEHGMRLEIDTRKLKIKEAVSMLMNDNEIEDINIEEPPLEEIIEDIYRR